MVQVVAAFVCCNEIDIFCIEISCILLSQGKGNMFMTWICSCNFDHTQGLCMEM